jgi:light-regulated signal transduction histidine kinase (bacteriophytochrome)
MAVQESHAVINIELLPTISGYTTEMKQLFQNLISNSLKFRKRGESPVINITAMPKQDHWQFKITDNGIGIDEKYWERIFIIFQRLHTKNEYAGTGIGLAHCKKIVELHNGKIWLDSVLGEGSTFYFTIKKRSTDVWKL